jgi:hypothetical protein
MALLKDVKGFGLPWEESYGFAQAGNSGLPFQRVIPPPSFFAPTNALYSR